MPTVDELLGHLRRSGQVEQALAKRQVFDRFRRESRRPWFAVWDSGHDRWRILSHDPVRGGERVGPIGSLNAAAIMVQLLRDESAPVVCSDDLTELVKQLRADHRVAARVK